MAKGRLNLAGLTELNLSTLEQIDGGTAVEMFKVEMLHAVRDCDDRPALKKPRTVTLECVITPESDDHGVLLGVSLDFHVKSKVPMRKTKPVHAFVDSKGRVLFNPNSPDNVNQQTIFDGEDDGHPASVPLAEAGA